MWDQCPYNNHVHSGLIKSDEKSLVHLRLCDLVTEGSTVLENYFCLSTEHCSDNRDPLVRGGGGVHKSLFWISDMAISRFEE